MSERQIQSTELAMAGYSVDNLAGSTQYSNVSYLEVCQKTFKSNLDYFKTFWKQKQVNGDF